MIGLPLLLFVTAAPPTCPEAPDKVVTVHGYKLSLKDKKKTTIDGGAAGLVDEIFLKKNRAAPRETKKRGTKERDPPKDTTAAVLMVGNVAKAYAEDGKESAADAP